MDAADSRCAARQGRESYVLCDWAGGTEVSLRRATNVCRRAMRLGNHTFTHPDISVISPAVDEAGAEPDGAAFCQPHRHQDGAVPAAVFHRSGTDTADQVRPLEVTQGLGYITVGIASIQRLANEPAALVRGNRGRSLPAPAPCSPTDFRGGSILLLHDGGGDRRATVRGTGAHYRRRSCSRARAGSGEPASRQDASEIMPPLSTNERWSARIDWFAFALGEPSFDEGDSCHLLSWRHPDDGKTGFRRVCSRSLTACAVVVMACPRNWPRSVQRLRFSFRPSMRRKVIERTILAALDSDYPNLRVIVIDDVPPTTRWKLRAGRHRCRLPRGT